MQVENSLNIQLAKDPKGKSREDKSDRRPEDPYDISDVIEMAETIAGCAQGGTASSAWRHGVNTVETRSKDHSQSYTTHSHGHNVKLEDDMRELTQKVALLMDQVTNSEKTQQSEIHQLLQTSRQDMQKLVETLTQQHVTTAPTLRQTGVKPALQDGCWYCEELGHFAFNCPHREEHLKTGKIKMVGNRIFFVHSGQPVPRGTAGKSAKDIVEEAIKAHFHKNNVAQSNMFASPGEVYTHTVEPGIIPLNNLSTGNGVASVFTNQLRDSRDDLIDNMKNQIHELTKAVQSAPALDSGFVNNIKSVLSYLERQQGQDTSAQYINTRRAQAESQGQSGF